MYIKNLFKHLQLWKQNKRRMLARKLIMTRRQQLHQELKLEERKIAQLRKTNLKWKLKLKIKI
jgi:hypothetical protein